MKTFASRESEPASRHPASVVELRRPSAAGAPWAAAALHDSPRQVAQRRQLEAAFGPAVQCEGLDEELPRQAKFAGDAHGHTPAEGGDGLANESNRTGMPHQLKAGIESLSGMDMSDVRVHTNSTKPAQLNALAYAQGDDIHLGPGQEQHLPHEAWHVVQQRQGRVQATMQMAGVGVNDDAGLESEADVMGGRAAAGVVQGRFGSLPNPSGSAAGSPVLQRATLFKKSVFTLPHWEVVAYGKNKDADATDKLWQIGFANPTAIAETSGSVATKSGSPSGWGGEGEVHWTPLREGTNQKSGYTLVVASGSEEHDQALLNATPANGTRETYRLTSKNCQHFIADAWGAAGLNPDIKPYLSVSAETGSNINKGLFGLGVLGLGALGVGLLGKERSGALLGEFAEGALHYALGGLVERGVERGAEGAFNAFNAWNKQEPKQDNDEEAAIQ